MTSHTADPTSDRDRLAGYVAVWWRAVEELCELLGELPEAEWSTPTDLPGWDVRACAAHIAHLENVLVGRHDPDVELGDLAHATAPTSLYTEIGVANRRDSTPEQIIAEIRAATSERHERLLADPPEDAEQVAEPGFPGMPWTWETALRNRPVDVWMHTQDIRRAVGRPGGLDSVAAEHTVATMLAGLPFLAAKRAGAGPGSTVVVEVGDLAPVVVEVGDDGRGRPAATAPASPTLRLRLGVEPYTLLAGGRRPVETVRSDFDVEVEGDAELAERLLGALNATP